MRLTLWFKWLFFNFLSLLFTFLSVFSVFAHMYPACCRSCIMQTLGVIVSMNENLCVYLRVHWYHQSVRVCVGPRGSLTSLCVITWPLNSDLTPVKCQLSPSLFTITWREMRRKEKGEIEKKERGKKKKIKEIRNKHLKRRALKCLRGLSFFQMV